MAYSDDLKGPSIHPFIHPRTTHRYAGKRPGVRRLGVMVSPLQRVTISRDCGARSMQKMRVSLTIHCMDSSVNFVLIPVGPKRIQQVNEVDHRYTVNRDIGQTVCTGVLANYFCIVKPLSHYRWMRRMNQSP